MNIISFNEFYKKWIELSKSFIADLETERIKECNEQIEYLKRYFIIMPIIVISIIFLIIKGANFNTFYLILSFLFICISGFYVIYTPIKYFAVILPKAIRDYKFSIKKVILPELCSFLGDIEWECNNEKPSCRECNYLISSSDTIDSGIVPFYSVSKAIDDKFSGTYNGVNFCIEELVNDVGKRIVLIKFPSNKKIINRVIVAPKHSITEKNKFYILAFFMLFVLILFLDYYLKFFELTLYEKIKFYICEMGAIY